jgi:hypothetical protein
MTTKVEGTAMTDIDTLTAMLAARIGHAGLMQELESCRTWATDCVDALLRGFAASAIGSGVSIEEVTAITEVLRANVLAALDAKIAALRSRATLN